MNRYLAINIEGKIGQPTVIRISSFIIGEIALTHLSLRILKKLGVWNLIDQNEVSLLKEAKVFDGDSASLLNFKSEGSGVEALGQK